MLCTVDNEVIFTFNNNLETLPLTPVQQLLCLSVCIRQLIAVHIYI